MKRCLHEKNENKLIFKRKKVNKSGLTPFLLILGISTLSHAYSSTDTGTLTPQYMTQTNIAEPNLATVRQQSGNLDFTNRCNFPTFNEVIYSLEATGGQVMSPPVQYMSNIQNSGSCNWTSCSSGYTRDMYTIVNPWLFTPDYYNVECAKIPGTVAWQ